MNSFRNHLVKGGLIGLTVLLGLTLSGCEPLEFTARCDTLAPTQVSVSTQPLQVTLDHTRPQASLQPEEDAQRRRTLGLTTANLKTSVQVGIAYKRDFFSHTLCARPRVEVELTVNPVLVQIGAEYPKGSCQYRAVLEHEQKHVGLYANYLEQTKDSLEKELTALLSPRPRLFSSEAEARATLESEIDRLLAPLAQEHLTKVKLLQATLDTPTAYAEFNTVCGGRFVPGTDGQLHAPTERQNMTSGRTPG